MHDFIGLEDKATYFDNRDVADSFFHLPHQIAKPVVFQ